MFIREFIQTDLFEDTDYDMVKLVASQQTSLTRCGRCAIAQPLTDIDGSIAQEWIWCPKINREKHISGYCSEAIPKE